jgi:hypothetical protein
MDLYAFTDDRKDQFFPSIDSKLNGPPVRVILTHPTQPRNDWMPDNTMTVLATSSSVVTVCFESILLGFQCSLKQFGNILFPFAVYFSKAPNCEQPEDPRMCLATISLYKPLIDGPSLFERLGARSIIVGLVDGYLTCDQYENARKQYDNAPVETMLLPFME